MKIKECMCLDVCYTNKETTVKEVSKLMNERHIGCIPICDENKNIEGIVTDRDIVLRCIACDKDVNTTPIKDIMTSNVCYCQANSEVSEAMNLMTDLQIRRIPVVENDKIVGMLTIGDIAKDKNIGAKAVSDTIEGICNHNKNNAE